jgi:hypothetical protein
MPKLPRTRNATFDEIQRSLRDAGDHLGAMMTFEAEAAAATTGVAQDLEANSEAHRKFVREFRAFLSAAATAWNYMNQGSMAAGTRRWLDQRLSSNLCKFHRELENQAAHDYRIEPGVRQRVTFESDPVTPMRQTTFGPMPVEMKVTGFKGVSYHHNPRSLEPDVAPLCESVQKHYPGETIVELAARYHDILQRTFRAGEQKCKFGDSEPPAHALPPTVLDAQVSVEG